MIIALSLLGVLISVILLLYNFRKNPSSVYLGLFFFLISLYSFIQYSILYSKSVTLVAVVFVNAGFPTYLIGPMFYFYTRSLLSDNPRLKKSDSVHLLPMILYLAFIFPYLLTPWSYKLEVAREFIEKTAGTGGFRAELVSIYQYLPVSVVYLSRPVLFAGYLIWSVALLFRFSFSHSESLLFRQRQLMKKWLWILSGFLFILLIGHGLQIMILVETKSTAIFRTLNVFQLFSAIGLIGLLISPLFFPQILYGMPRVPVPAVHSQVEKAAKEPESLIGNKAPVSFEADYINRLGALTDGCMSDYKPYLQQEFNLTQLSVMINIPVHHLAWYFREIKNRSFTDFRNEWRIQHAKGLIRQGKTAEMTLEAIGMLSGFFSRNTFITAFKKFEGITPSEYVAKLTRLAPKGST